MQERTTAKLVINEEGARPVKIWTNDVEPEALAQLKNLSRLPFIAKEGVACMPDVHAGIGSTVGTVIATDKAIIPAAVGVDIGCVDKETEFMSPTGWKKISDWDGEQVLQFEAETGLAWFTAPERYIKKPSAGFYCIKTKYGVNQKISADHKVFAYRLVGRKRTPVESIMTGQQLYDEHTKNVLGFRGKFLTAFAVEFTTGVPYSDDMLRLLVAVSADGHIRTQSTGNVVVGLKKQRKINRLIHLLVMNGIDYSVWQDDGAHKISFNIEGVSKDLSRFYAATKAQLKVIADECLLWDGDQDSCYYSRIKQNADFIQYAFSATGYRSVMREDEKGDAIDYRVFRYENPWVGISGSPKTEMTFEPSEDGMEYCFTVQTGYWVMRRGGNVVVTGNCGMVATRLSLKAHQLPDSLARIRSAIETVVPMGTGGQHKMTPVLGRAAADLMLAIPHSVSKVLGDEDKTHAKALPQIGTLGSGNHFIEICIDQNDDVWVMLHSGSRGIGNMIGKYYIEKGKELMNQFHITLPDGDLAYLPQGTDLFDDYVAAVQWAQDYAMENRKAMLAAVLDVLRKEITVPFGITEEAINCHHNYVVQENHFGKNLWITRKGAIKAGKDDLGIIPSAMGQTSFIVRGKGNKESYCSCSHGSGRKMSRTKAKQQFTVADLIAQTRGVECRKDAAVLDEIPSSYKDIETVMKNQESLVEVVHRLKAVLCCKGA